MTPSDPVDGLIREALAEVVSRAPLAPDFEDLGPRQTGRHRRMGMLVGAAVLIVVVVAVAAVALPGGDDPIVTVGTPTPSDTATPSDSAQGPFVGVENESAEDVAERFMSDVLGAPSVTVGVTDTDGRTSVVRMETSTGAIVEATVVANPALQRTVLQTITSAGLSFSESDGPQITVPEPGLLTIIGYDGAFTEPGEIMIDRLPVSEAGVVGPLDLVESSWLRIDFVTPDGRVLHDVRLRGEPPK